jgi:TPR repeat protein
LARFLSALYSPATKCKTKGEGVDYFYQVDAYPELREDLHEDAHAGQTAASGKSSASAEAPGQRLLKWLTSGVIAVLLVYGLVLATAHVLARIVGMPRAQIVLAQLYPGDYWWHPTDKAYAKELLREAVSAGDANAQYVLACSFEDEKNYAQAFPLYQDLALKGWAGAQKRLGVMYIYGRGVSQNTNQGIRWIKTAAAQGDVVAHLFLGAIYSEGLPDLPQDFSQAAQWFQSSAYLGNGKAQDSLALLYATGKGVPKNLDMAMYWADKSRDAGHAPAQVTVQFIQSLKEGKK